MIHMLEVVDMLGIPLVMSVWLMLGATITRQGTLCGVSCGMPILVVWSKKLGADNSAGLLQSDKGTPSDKLRAALVYLLTCESLPSDAEYEQISRTLQVRQPSRLLSCAVQIIL